MALICCCLLITIALLVLTTAPSARAQTLPVLLTVAKTADTNDGTCDNDCSLREAISQANADGQNDTIQFAHGVSGSIVLDRAFGTLVISGDMTIDGPGANVLSVSGANSDLPFSVGNGVNATIDKLSIIKGDSGGIYNDGILTLNSSTVSGNSATAAGGIYNGGTLTINDSTVSGNTTYSDGGGIYNEKGLTKIESSTVTKNTAPFGNGSGVASYADSSTSTEVFSSIISANTNNADVALTGGFNAFKSDGYNLIGEGNATAAFNQPGDQSGITNPRLGALANNGGPTQTHALLKGSPALNKSTNAGCPATDQRGESRPQATTCDIGSYEKKSKHHH